MSEWDYLPTPYECAIHDESEQSILTFMSFCCLVEGHILTPTQIFIMCGEEDKYKWFLNDIIEKTSLQEVLRTILQYEDIRSHKKQERLIETLKSYVDRRREKDL